MLSYRHQFHAGGVADVFKHAVLVRLLLALARKDKPFFVLDTHGGLGRYDLDHPWSEKTGEWRHGVGRIWEAADPPADLAPYLAAVAAENPGGALKRYPGSPLIARRLMRPGDRLAVCELNRDDHAALAARLEGYRDTGVHAMDGFQAVRAMLPPKERRGLVLIDASFDQADEFARILRATGDALRRFRTGMVAIWHPLMAPEEMQAFYADLKALDPPKTLRLELRTHPPDWQAFRPGSGMIVINPPYGLDAEAPPLLDWLWRTLTPAGSGGWTVKWLVAEGGEAVASPPMSGGADG